MAFVPALPLGAARIGRPVGLAVAAAAAASRLGSGGVSRYEAFYRPAAGGSESLALDVTAVPCDGDGETPPSNPFFVGYPEEELAALWAIHQDVVGARPDAADEGEDEEARGGRGGGGDDGGRAGGEGPPGGGDAPAKLGLHETILKALEGGEGDASTDGDSP